MLLPPVGHAELPAHEQRKPKVCCLLTTETSGSCCCSLRLSRVSITTAASAPTFAIPGITHELSSVHGLLCARAHAKQRNSMHNQLANVQAKDANPSTACKSTYPPLTIRNRTNTYWCSSSSNPNAHRMEPSHGTLTLVQSRRHVHPPDALPFDAPFSPDTIARRARFSRAESRPGDEATEAAASEAIDL